MRRDLSRRISASKLCHGRGLVCTLGTLFNRGAVLEQPVSCLVLNETLQGFCSHSHKNSWIKVNLKESWEIHTKANAKTIHQP